MENEDYESKLTELELEIDDVEIIETIKPIKKKRKPMTAEHKAKCMASFKKAKAKKIMKEKDDAEVDKILDLHIKSKAEKEEAKDKEISALKKKLDSLTLQDIIPKPPKVKPPPPPAEEDAEAEGSDMEVDLTPYTPPSAVRTPQPSVKVEPLAPIKVISNSIPSIRRHIVRPKMKPRM